MKEPPALLRAFSILSAGIFVLQSPSVPNPIRIKHSARSRQAGGPGLGLEVYPCPRHKASPAGAGVPGVSPVLRGPGTHHLAAILRPPARELASAKCLYR